MLRENRFKFIANGSVARENSGIDHIAAALRRFRHIRDPLQMRIQIFEYVRDIPYFTGGSHDAIVPAEANRGNCVSKTRLLAQLLNALGFETRIMKIKYRLRSFPAEVMYIPDQIDYHQALEVNVDAKWVLVDATYDTALRGYSFIVNAWDGRTPTPLSESPLAIRLEGQDNVLFDAEYQGFLTRLSIANQMYPKEFSQYTKKFNDILQRFRRQGSRSDHIAA